ncbi:MAG: hypothetical protein JNJ94_12240 [Chlorobi bacterium]|nr:hypothetical protein [Chlorobiota bacterium]
MNYNPEDPWKEIEQVELRKLDTQSVEPKDEPEFRTIQEIDSKPVGDWELSWWEKLKLGNAILTFINDWRAGRVKNWRTTLLGIAGAVVLAIIDLAKNGQLTTQGAITAILVAAGGYLAADSKNTRVLLLILLLGVAGCSSNRTLRPTSTLEVRGDTLAASLVVQYRDSVSVGWEVGSQVAIYRRADSMFCLDATVMYGQQSVSYNVGCISLRQILAMLNPTPPSPPMPPVAQPATGP